MDLLFSYLAHLTSRFGYGGICFAVALEYACFPISSEILFPFLGCCAAAGNLRFSVALLASTLGALAGSSLCYGAARLFGRTLYPLLARHLPAMAKAWDAAGRFFLTRGETAVFWGRMIPLVRTYLSFPAGLSGMAYGRFLLWTGAGAFCWNFVLLSAGYLLGEQWQQVAAVFSAHPAAVFFLSAGLVAAVVIHNHWQKGGDGAGVCRWPKK